MNWSPTIDGRAWTREIRGAVVYPLTSNVRLAIASIGTAITYVVLVLSSFPQFSIQLLARNPTDVGYAISTLTREVYRSTGWIGLGLVALYALLTGIAVTNSVTLVRRARHRGASTVVGVLPGMLAAGCASCGAGVLGALGFVGAMAVLPFDGNLLRAGGILLLLFFLGRAGDPRTCPIRGGQGR